MDVAEEYSVILAYLRSHLIPAFLHVHGFLYNISVPPGFHLLQQRGRVVLLVQEYDRMRWKKLLKNKVDSQRPQNNDDNIHQRKLDHRNDLHKSRRQKDCLKVDQHVRR